MPTTEKLGRRSLEYGIAAEELRCDSCGKPITAGCPYLKRQTIKQIESEFVVVTTVECLTACSVHQAALLRASDEEPLDERPIRYAKCWDAIPKHPIDEEQSLRIVTHRGGNVVARGYTRILEWVGPRGLNRYLECDPAQVNEKMFALAPQNSDAFGAYQSWRTPDGIIVREYLKDQGTNRSGYWYMPLAVLEAFPAVVLPRTGDAK